MDARNFLGMLAKTKFPIPVGNLTQNRLVCN